MPTHPPLGRSLSHMSGAGMANVAKLHLQVSTIDRILQVSTIDRILQKEDLVLFFSSSILFLSQYFPRCLYICKKLTTFHIVN